MGQCSPEGVHGGLRPLCRCHIARGPAGNIELGMLVDSIRQLFFEKGLGYAEIARVTGFDVKTVKKYVHMEDFNQPLPEAEADSRLKAG